MMKKLLFPIVVCFVFVLSLNVVHAAEMIDHYGVDITINTDASIDVVETIDYDFDGEQRHGIFRDIPVKYKTSAGNNRKIRISNIAVSDENGDVYTFKREKNGRDTRIRIGDADAYVSGTKTYVIAYTVSGAINYFDTHDELYWNVIGDQWQVAMSDISVQVRTPGIERTECFVGAFGSRQECDQSVIKDSSSVFSHKKLSTYEGMTIVVGMPVGTVIKPTVVEKILLFIRDNWIVSIPLLVALMMYRRWWYHGKDPRGRGTIVPQYTAPDDLTPAEIGTIVDERAQNKDVSATLIDLAVRGYVKIEKTQTDALIGAKDEYVFHKLKEGSDLVNAFERKFLDQLFDGTDRTELSELKNTFYKDLAEITKDIYTVTQEKKYFVKNPQKVRGMYMGAGIAGLFLSFWGGGFLSGLVGAVIIPIGLASSVIVLLFGIIMPKRTLKGVHAREKILGLKQYLEVAEKDRIAFHNAPEKTPEKFEKLLPIAMVLGVEEQWAKQFEGIYKGSPQWYEGAGQFNASSLVHELNGFNKTASATLSSKPSSAGSGGSGFSGGGSGGGMGGGGGGSW